MPSPRRALVNAVVLFLVSCGLIRLVVVATKSFGLSDNWYIVPALLFIFLPDLYGWWADDPVDQDVVQPRPLGPALWTALRWFFGLVLLIYPAFVIGNHIWQAWLLPELSTWFVRGYPELAHQLGLRYAYPPHVPQFHWLESQGFMGLWHVMPRDLHWLALWHLLPVGYAEEFFYRGWMQTYLDRSMGKRWTVFGARIGPGFFWTAVLFTIGHSLVEWQWWQPFILFPALIFGWLRARTGTILAGTFFHAFANVAMIMLDTLYGVRAP